MKRNWGISVDRPSKYPPGCDWDKPRDCRCKLWAQAQSCPEQCEDAEGAKIYSRWLAFYIFVAVMVFVMAFFTTARADAPFYCKPLMKFERSCVGVKTAAATLGRAYAERLARRCGATDEDIAQARQCFRTPRDS